MAFLATCTRGINEWLGRLTSICTFKNALDTQRLKRRGGTANRLRDFFERPAQNAVLRPVMHQAHHADPDAFFGMRTAAQIAVRLPIRWIKLERGTFHRSVDSRAKC